MDNFDHWRHLYETDPAEYERQRTEYLNQAILAAPIKYRHSMRIMQLECDTIRLMYPPLEATVKMVELMTKKLNDISVSLTELREIIEDSKDSDTSL
jgi:hypothetical protein